MTRTYKAGYDIGSRVFLVICAAGMVLGSAFIIFNEVTHKVQLQSLKWPTVRGTMMQADPGSRIRRSRGHTRTVYFADVTYTYLVNDKRQVAHRVSLWNPQLASDRLEVLGFLGQHPVGSFVEVHYDPQQPDRAVLIPGADEAGHTLIRWCGIAMFTAGALGLIRTRQAFGRVRRPAGGRRFALAR